MQRNRLLFTLFIAVLFAFPAVSQAAGSKAVHRMQAKLKGEIQHHPGMKAPVKKFAVRHLLPTINNAVWVKAIEEQNAKHITMAQIHATDKQWINAEDELPIQKELISNACAKELFRLSKRLPVIREAFVMDNQGANVCMNNLTSDYWQGDEAKWQKSFNGGKGGVDVGKAKFDKSANITEQQVSLPIVNKAGKVIGAVTFGLAVDQM